MGNRLFCEECMKDSNRIKSVEESQEYISINKGMEDSYKSPFAKILANAQACGDQYHASLGSSTSTDGNSVVDPGTEKKIQQWIQEDYRGFVMLVHDSLGMMMLHCTRKKNKPPHYQLPGGHVDDFEFKNAAKELANTISQGKKGDEKLILYRAAQLGCARELFEETGLNFQSQLNRFLPLVIKDDDAEGPAVLKNEFKSRLFFVLSVTTEDLQKSGPSTAKPDENNIPIQISHEHSGYKFEPDISKCIAALQYHSGGKVSKALQKAYSV